MKSCKHGSKVFYLNSKPACPNCDELLIDLEIEIETEEVSETKRTFQKEKGPEPLRKGPDRIN